MGINSIEALRGNRAHAPGRGPEREGAEHSGHSCTQANKRPIRNKEEPMKRIYVQRRSGAWGATCANITAPLPTREMDDMVKALKDVNIHPRIHIEEPGRRQLCRVLPPLRRAPVRQELHLRRADPQGRRDPHRPGQVRGLLHLHPGPAPTGRSCPPRKAAWCRSANCALKNAVGAPACVAGLPQSSHCVRGEVSKHALCHCGKFGPAAVGCIEGSFAVRIRRATITLFSKETGAYLFPAADLLFIGRKNG